MIVPSDRTGLSSLQYNVAVSTRVTSSRRACRVPACGLHLSLKLYLGRHPPLSLLIYVLPCDVYALPRAEFVPLDARVNDYDPSPPSAPPSSVGRSSDHAVVEKIALYVKQSRNTVNACTFSHDSDTTR